MRVLRYSRISRFDKNEYYFLKILLGYLNKKGKKDLSYHILIKILVELRRGYFQMKKLLKDNKKKIVRPVIKKSMARFLFKKMYEENNQKVEKIHKILGRNYKNIELKRILIRKLIKGLNIENKKGILKF